MSENTMNVGLGMVAFAAGVMAGADAVKKLDGMSKATLTERLAYYWLSCGAVLGSRFPDATDEMQLQFIAGASSRVPSSPVVSVTIDNVDGAAFCDEGGEYDEYRARIEIARILAVASARLADGYDGGPLKDGNGQTVGMFTYHPSL
jgi:hypothetical protein